MEGNSEQVHDSGMDNVEPRGGIEYQAKDGSIHFFGSPEELADFREQENDPSNSR